MEHLKENLVEYLDFCAQQKRLDPKTIKAYRIDLQQCVSHAVDTTKSMQGNDVSSYVAELHSKYEPKTVKRKIASLKAFTKYLQEYKNIHVDWFRHINIKFREPKKLPKIIALHNIEALLVVAYQERDRAESEYKKICSIRDVAVVELLLGTGMRISEMCSLKLADIDLTARMIRIFGKGAKERTLSIGNDILTLALRKYMDAFASRRKDEAFFFLNGAGHRLSEQSVRLVLKRYAKMAGISQNITPHMFRHSFATLLLEQDVDIRYIQKMLGHSSISVTEIYTYVSSSKQREILFHKNPRNLINVVNSSNLP